MTIDQWLHRSTKLLQNHKINSAHLDCSIIIEQSLGKSREWIIAHGDTEVESSVLKDLAIKIKKRQDHIPIAYIIGHKEFYGRSFYVNQKTLIPRPESEEIISQLLYLVDNNLLTNDATIVDIGTGPGILAITAKLELPQATVCATDISESALRVARRNASNNRAQIQLYRADLLDIPKAIKPRVVLANLPYVPEGLITSDEIKYEPKLALFSGDDGLDLYQKFWQQLINLEYKPTYIITESLESQHKKMSQLARPPGYYLSRHDGLIQVFILDNKLIKR